MILFYQVEFIENLRDILNNLFSNKSPYGTQKPQNLMIWYLSTVSGTLTFSSHTSFYQLPRTNLFGKWILKK